MTSDDDYKRLWMTKLAPFQIINLCNAAWACGFAEGYARAKAEAALIELNRTLPDVLEPRVRRADELRELRNRLADRHAIRSATE